MEFFIGYLVWVVPALVVYMLLVLTLIFLPDEKDSTLNEVVIGLIAALLAGWMFAVVMGLGMICHICEHLSKGVGKKVLIPGSETRRKQNAN